MFKLYKVEVALPQTKFRQSRSAAKTITNALNFDKNTSTSCGQDIRASSIAIPLAAPTEKEQGREILTEEKPQGLIMKEGKSEETDTPTSEEFASMKAQQPKTTKAKFSQPRRCLEKVYTIKAPTISQRLEENHIANKNKVTHIGVN